MIRTLRSSQGRKAAAAPLKVSIEDQCWGLSEHPFGRERGKVFLQNRYTGPQNSITRSLTLQKMNITADTDTGIKI